MRGLSLTQPWATLVALGHKRVETRSWSTSYRGEILIHAAKGFPRDVQEMCADEPFLAALKGAGFTNTNQLPRGVIVAVAKLTGIARTEEWTAMSQGLLRHEIEFGDYSPGRFGWALSEVRALREAIPCKGALGLWAVPPDIVASITRIEFEYLEDRL